MASIDPTTNADNGSANPTDIMIWGWNSIDIIGWDNAAKMGGVPIIDSDVGSIAQTPASGGGSISPT